MLVHAKLSAFPMRRLSAISLVLLMLLPMLMPLTALGQDEDANLPVCCRRHGGMRHHCSMFDGLPGIALAGNKVDGDAGSVPGLPEHGACLSTLSTRTEFRFFTLR